MLRMLLSGCMLPRAQMPVPNYLVTVALPVTYFLEITPDDDPDGPEREERISLMFCESLSPLEPATSE